MKIPIEMKNFCTVFVEIDDEDYEKIKNFNWKVSFSNKFYFYAVHRHGIKQNCTRRKRITYALHRLIMGLSNDDKRVVDHINGNNFDNRKKNLRICTIQENNYNITNISGKSKYQGVSDARKASKNKPWRATISCNNKTKHIGYFKTEEEAALAYNKKALQLRGKFAKLNKIEIEEKSDD